MSPLPSLSGHPRALWVLFAATLVNRAGWMVLPFLTLYLTRDLGRTPGEAGVVLAVYGVVCLATSPIAGALSDRLGAALVMRASLFLSAAILFAFPLARSYPLVLAATALLAFSHELYRPAHLSIISAIADEKARRSAYALMRLAVSLGMTVGPAAGGLLVGSSFPLLFVADAATTLLAGVMLVVAFRPRVRGGAAAPAPAPAGSALLSGLSDRRLRLVLAAATPVIMVFSQHFSSLSVYAVRDLGLSERAYGLTFTLDMVLIVALQVPLTRATARWPAGRTMALGAILCGVGFGAVGLATSAPAIFAAVVPMAFAEMLVLPSFSAHVADIAPPDRRGAYMGLYSMTFNLCFSAGPWLGGEILARLGPQALWGGCFVACLLSCLMMTRVSDP